MPDPDRVVVEANGKAFDKWTSYKIDSDLLTPADAFELKVPMLGSLAARAELREVFKPGSSIKIYVVRMGVKSLQLTGIVDASSATGDRGGTTLKVSGRDLAQHLTDSGADPRLGIADSKVRTVHNSIPTGGIGGSIVPVTITTVTGGTFAEIVRKLVGPWGLEVVTDASAARDVLTGRSRLVSGGRLSADMARNLGVPVEAFRRSMVTGAAAKSQPLDELIGASTAPSARARHANELASSDIERLTLQDAKPAVGESVWEFIERHAKRFGLMLWFSPDGKLILSSPNYGSAPLYRFVRRLRERPDDRNNVLRGGAEDRMGDRCSHMTVYGKAGGRNPERSRFSAVAVDEEVPFYRPRYLHDEAIRSDEAAQRLAGREIAERKANAFEYPVEVADHGQGSYFYAIDNMAEVDDEVVAVKGSYYVVGRTLLKDVDSDATRTQLRLMPKGAIAL